MFLRRSKVVPQQLSDQVSICAGDVEDRSYTVLTETGTYMHIHNR